MTKLNQLKCLVDDLIVRYGADYNVAFFLVTEGDLQDLHLDLCSAIEGQEELPLSPRQLEAGISHLEHNPTAIAKLFGVPAHEALEHAADTPA